MIFVIIKSMAYKRLKISKNKLYLLYTKKQFSARKIAKICHYEQTAILNRLRKFNIPIKHLKEKINISKKELKKLYTERKFSAYKIANIFKCQASTIYRYLKLYKIKTRPLKRLKLTKEKLKELYIDKRFPFSKIARICKCSAAGVLKKMRKYKILSRTLSEANTKHFKVDFDGDFIKKAYMIGFRLGDLRIRKDKNLINAGCGTTKTAQIQLIKDLFGKYGPIWISKRDKRNAYHADCSLNLSFKFLLPKHKSIPKWILRNNKNFFSFLAGYTDAEGNIGIYNKRARFRLRSYDKEILEDINVRLKLFGIKSLFSLDKKAHIDKRGVSHNKDSWIVVVNEKKSLLKLFNTIESLLKHKKRKQDLLKAKQNVILRLKDRP